jgi:hypothetical protein
MEDQLYEFVKNHLFETLILLYVFNCAVSALQDEPETFFDWFKDFMRALSSPAAILRRKRHHCEGCPVDAGSCPKPPEETSLARREHAPDAWRE